MLDKLIRYSEVADLLGDTPDGTILEVGAGPLGLGSCLPYRFVGVDPWYPEPPISTQTAVKASAEDLPFRDRSFDYVLCIEVLEHIPTEIRGRIVSEMCRVARKKVVITHPWGKSARWGDQFLGVIYDTLKIFGKGRPWWLIEHLKADYPDPSQYLMSMPVGFRSRVRGRENTFVHVALVFFTHLKFVHRRLDRVHHRWPGLLRRVTRWVHFPPYSRAEVILERQT